MSNLTQFIKFCLNVHIILRLNSRLQLFQPNKILKTLNFIITHYKSAKEIEMPMYQSISIIPGNTRN